MIRISKLDWNAIKVEYISGEISVRKLAAKYGVPYPTLRDRATREEWTKDRLAVRNKTVEQTLQKTASQTASNAAIAERIREKLLRKLEKEIDSLPDLIGSNTQQAVVDNEYDEKGKRLKKIKEARKEYRLRDLTAAYKDLIQDMPKESNSEQVRIVIDV